MNKPLISVIIPVYNAEKYLNESIQSVINQTWQNKELIIVDDASNDNSYNIAKSYENEWIRVFKFDKNKGQSITSNFGYLQSKGSFIKYLDADDIINKDFLSSIILNLKDRNSLYFSHCINFTGTFESNEQVEYTIEGWKNMNPIDFLISPTSYMRQGGRWLIPRRVIEKAGLWNESLSLINDFEYFNRLCLNSNHIYYIKEAVLYYRQVSNSVSSRKSKEALESGFKSIKLAGELLLKYENSERVRKYFANSLQGMLYMIYPKYSSITKKIEKKIKSLGGADKILDAGGATLFLYSITNWKFALFSRYYLRTLIRILKKMF